MLFICPILILLPAHSAPLPVTPGKTVFAPNYVRLNQSLVKNDVAGAAKLMRPDYIYVLSDKTNLRRDEYLSRIFSSVQALKSRKCWTVIDGVHHDPAGTTLDVRRFTTGIQPEGQDRRQHLLKRISTGSDLWVKGAKGWLLKKSISTKSIAFVDGKISRSQGGIRIGGFFRAK